MFLSTGIPDSERTKVCRMPNAHKTKQGRGVVARGKSAPLVKARPAIPEAKPDRGTIGARLVICRNAKKMTKAAVARTLGIKPQSYGDLETGDSNQPAADTLLDMRDKLGYDIDFVMKGRGMPLLPNFEEMARETALISIFRELHPDIKDEAVRMVQTLRRAQRSGPSPNDPFLRDPPRPGDQD